MSKSPRPITAQLDSPHLRCFQSVISRPKTPGKSFHASFSFSATRSIIIRKQLKHRRVSGIIKSWVMNWKGSGVLIYFVSSCTFKRTQRNETLHARGCAHRSETSVRSVRSAFVMLVEISFSLAEKHRPRSSRDKCSISPSSRLRL